jgi:arylsulfatase A-like enzyme
MEKFPDVMAANMTLEFLAQRDVARSFWATCAFPGPHSPWVIPAEFGIRYDAREIPMWPNRHDSFAGKPINQKKLRLRDRLRPPTAPWTARDDDELLREMLAVNFSYIELIDEQIGRLVADLKRRGLYERTAIIFTADHGDMAGAHGLMSKGAYMYDEIMRIPLVVKPAGPPAPRRCGEFVSLADVTSTIMHLAAGTEPGAMDGQPLHGQSLVPALTGGQWPRSVAYGEYHGDWYGHSSVRMVTDGRWKLAWSFGDLSELYNLESDPHELHNRFPDPALADVREHYWHLLLEEAERTADGQVPLAARGGLDVELETWVTCTTSGMSRHG